MRALIQRVSHAEVSILDDTPPADEQPIRSIGRGFAILLGVSQDDGEEQVAKLWGKISKMRVFEDADGKTNLSLSDVGGEVMVVSQFTLYANCKKGNRPSFTDAMEPGEAERLYEYFVGLARRDFGQVATGRFGADMDIALVNHGPFTVLLDTDAL